MKKRLLSLALALCMVCTLLPFGALAGRTANSDACFQYLRNYAREKGTQTIIGDTCQQAVENGTISMTYLTASSELRLKYTAEQDGATYVVELTIPASVQMPYDATQTMTKGLMIRNNAKIPDGFTLETQLDMDGITVEDSNRLFTYGLSYLLMSVQEQFMKGTNYTIADLGFGALLEELEEQFEPTPTPAPTAKPTAAPTPAPTAKPTAAPIPAPTAKPTAAPTPAPTAKPTAAPTPAPTAKPTAAPTPAPTAKPTAAPTPAPTAKPTAAPTPAPTAKPTAAPTPAPTAKPTAAPTPAPTAKPTAAPTPAPTAKPTAAPTPAPTAKPTAAPTPAPTAKPTAAPTPAPTAKPTAAPERKNPFTDVEKGQYYYDPVLWAVNHTPQITAGTSATTFAPAATCTRGQVVTFLWRASGCPEPTIKSNPFRDVKTSDYYYKAVLWASEKGITAGTSATTFSPNDPCTRAHVVTFLWRADGKPPAGGTNPFRDVAGGRYYTDAVLWAVEENITAGTSATTFSPDNPCTRGQIVTFLYRDKT